MAAINRSENMDTSFRHENMQHGSNMLLKRLGQSVLFVASLLVGLVIGIVVLGGGYWLVTATPLGAQLQTLLGITAKAPWHFSRAKKSWRRL